MLELRKMGCNKQMSVLGSNEKGARLIRARVRGDLSTATSVIAGKVGSTAFVSRGGGYKEAISKIEYLLMDLLRDLTKNPVFTRLFGSI
jgi:hypothetical protein